GNARMVAVMSAGRAPAFPDVPTMRDLGYPNFAVESWYGIFAPAGTPAPIVAKLSAEIDSILKEPDIQAHLARQGMTPVGGPPGRLAEFVQEELPRGRRVADATGLTPE